MPPFAAGFPPEIPSPEAAVGLLGMLFSHAKFYTVVAELDGRSAIAGVGPITVDPAAQNQGVGRGRAVDGGCHRAHLRCHGYSRARDFGSDAQLAIVQLVSGERPAGSPVDEPAGAYLPSILY